MRSVDVPLTVRLSHEIPQPKDWQAFQRGCVILFRDELRDPTAQAFGRNGQRQGGIDLLGRRDDWPDHLVGVQCRLTKARDPYKKVLADCRAAIGLGFGLRELVFATTAPDDARATATAMQVERLLRTEGHDLKVTIYGWGSLQELIARHPEAYLFFFPAAAASDNTLSQGTPRVGAEEFAVAVARHLDVIAMTREPPGGDLSAEDPKLHARVDAYRNLYKEDGETLAAERRLRGMLDAEDLSDRPWARFRIESILGSIAIDAGREPEAAERFERAHALRPDDPDALSRLALARTIQGRHDEAVEIARSVMRGESPPDYVVGVLLQATARSEVEVDPEDLIPSAMRGTAAADLGLAEFLRLRGAPGWERRALALASRHAGVPEFRRVRGLATLSVLVASDAVIPGVRSPLGWDDVQQGADDLRAAAEHCLAVRHAGGDDLMAHLSNAGAMLRLAGRFAEAEDLMRRGAERLPGEPHVLRQLALARCALGRRREAARTLDGQTDPENVLLRADLASDDDPAAALEVAAGLDPAALPPELAGTWARMVGDLAARVGDRAATEAAVATLRRADPGDLVADLLEVEWDDRAGADETETRERVRAIVAAAPAGTGGVDRYLAAAKVRSLGLADEAAGLLEPDVDLRRGGAAVNLYLQCLSEARRDAAFREAVEAVPEAARDVALQWTMAVHAWNVGDLDEAERLAAAITRLEPENAQAGQLRLEVLIRKNSIDDVLVELDRPIERRVASSSLGERCRVATLLGHFGHVARGAALAYRLFLENRGESQAWVTLAGIVIDAGRPGAPAASALAVSRVGPDAAVDMRFDDGSAAFCIVEVDEDLRRLDHESWEPGHATVQAMAGMAPGDRFVDATGRAGTVTQVRHKYVACFHQILEEHRSRFPEVNGFRRIDVDPARPDGLEKVVEQLRDRAGWYRDEQRSYLEAPWPLGALATRLGVDAIEAAAGLVSAGHALKVSDGGLEERVSANGAVAANRRRGCVMDLLCFWTAWELKALEVVAGVCGRVHLAQGVIDRLNVRRDNLLAAVDGGLRSAALVAGRMVLSEAEPDLVRAWLAEVDGALAWAAANTAVEPVIVDDGLPAELRDYMRQGQGDVLDALIVARRGGLLLLTDDGPTRALGRGIGKTSSVWPNHVLTLAFMGGRLRRDDRVRWSASLVDRGHHYMGVSGAALATAAALDADAGATPGPLLRSLLRCIGGSVAEPASHVHAVVGCLRDLWSRPDAASYREAAASHVLRALVRGRRDHPELLRAVRDRTGDMPPLARHLDAWIPGHFLKVA